MGIFLKDIFDPQAIILNLQGKTKDEVFIELSKALAAANPECDPHAMFEALWEREKKMSTGVASGVAIPHTTYRGLKSAIGAIGVSQTGIEYDALDDKPVYVIFMLVLGEPVEESHLRILNQISRLAQSEALALVRQAKTVQDISAILSRF